jgi:hypothetical protein
MRKSPYKGLGVVAAAVAAAAIAVPLGFGSSHREAPNIALDPSADNTDVYAFTAKDRPDALTIASGLDPGPGSSQRPNFFGSTTGRRYYVNIDNTGDGVADIRYLFKFRPTSNPNSSCTQAREHRTFTIPG